MVAADMAGAAAPRAVRRHSAADMAAVAARDVGRRNGMGRKCAVSPFIPQLMSFHSAAHAQSHTYQL